MAGFENSRGGFLDSIPVVTKNLLIINVLMWVATFVLQRRGIDLDAIFGLHYWEASSFAIWQPLTYMFLHDSTSIQNGLMHIFCNMFNLWMFGVLLERLLGARRFLIYYLTCGVGAAVVQEVVWCFTWITDFASVMTIDGEPATVSKIADLLRAGDADLQGYLESFYNCYITVGASGAVFGLLLAFGMSFPNFRMFIIPFPFPIKAKWMVIGYGVFELVCGVSGAFSSVAHYAHLGGLIFGFFLIMYWKRTGVIGGDDYGFMG